MCLILKCTQADCTCQPRNCDSQFQRQTFLVIYKSTCKHHLLLSGLATFGCYRTFWKQFDLRLTPDDPPWPLTPVMYYFLVRVLPSKFVSHRAFLSNLTPDWLLVDSSRPLHDIRPHYCTTFQAGVIPTKFGSHRSFLKQLDPSMTFDLWWVASKNCP